LKFKIPKRFDFFISNEKNLAVAAPSFLPPFTATTASRFFAALYPGNKTTIAGQLMGRATGCLGGGVADKLKH